MDNVKIVRSLAEFLTAIREPAFLMGLHGKPATPWYIGQADLGGSLLPAFFKSNIDPYLEREVLREFKQTAIEFAPTKGSDADLMLLAHMNGLPSRILEWMSNPIVALFLAVENMAAEQHGRIWVLDPWEMNKATSKLAYVPMTDTEYFARYVVNLTNPEAHERPGADLPMAFRPFRTSRMSNMHSIYYTVHGKSATPIEELKDSSKFATYFLVDLEQKRSILKELFNIGVTRANLFPDISSLAKTLAYRYSYAYLRE
jgi:hypothetical protein